MQEKLGYREPACLSSGSSIPTEEVLAIVLAEARFFQRRGLAGDLSNGSQSPRHHLPGFLPLPSLWGLSQARTGRLTPWLKCPKCKRASQPPEHLVRPPVRSIFEPSDDVLVIKESPYATMPAQANPSPFASHSDVILTPLSQQGRAGAPIIPNHSDPFANGEPVSIRRVVLTTLLFISLMMLLFMYLSQNPFGVPIAMASSVICLVLLIIPSRS